MIYNYESQLIATFIDPLLAARRVYESIYKTRETNNRQAPVSYLEVPFFSLKTPLNQKEEGTPPPTCECHSHSQVNLSPPDCKGPAQLNF